MLLYILGRRHRYTNSSSGDSSVTISTASLKRVICDLKNQQHRSSTKKNYYAIWKAFNHFFLKLDVKPSSWEERLTLYVGYLLSKKRKSNTIKSYISAIKAVLKSGNIQLCIDNALLSALTQVCRLKYHTVQPRLPINKNLLEVILRTVPRLFKSQQPYLITLYKALYITAYYGLFRVGEITKSPHVVKLGNVFIATNKDKLMFILHSSKTHDQGDKSQIVKIEGMASNNNQCKEISAYCPFELLQRYSKIRPTYSDENEQFFVFRDGSPVTSFHFQATLRRLLILNNLNPSLCCSHAFRSRCSGNLLEMGVSVETIRKLDRWKSSAVYTYLRT